MAGARREQRGVRPGRGGHGVALHLLRLRAAQAVVARRRGAPLPEHGLAPGQRRQGGSRVTCDGVTCDVLQGFTSAGGSRDSSVTALCWHAGSLYSGDTAGLVCKVGPCSMQPAASDPPAAVGLHAEPRLGHQHLQPRGQPRPGRGHAGGSQPRDLRGDGG